MVDVFSSEALWYASWLSEQSSISRIKMSLRVVGFYRSYRRTLEDHWMIDFDDARSAILPIAYMIARWPSLKKKYWEGSCFSIVDFKRILISLARIKNEHDKLEFIPMDENLENEIEGDASERDPLEQAIEIESSREIDKAIRWNLYKVNLRLVISVDSKGVMNARLNLKNPRRSWAATSKILQRKKVIPSELTTTQSERVLFDAIKTLPDFAKLHNHQGRLVVTLPDCFNRGWPAMIQRLRKNSAFRTEFCFLNLAEYYSKYCKLDDGYWPENVHLG